MRILHNETRAAVSVAGLILVFACSTLFAQQPAAPLEAEAEEMRPGLFAEYRSQADANAVLHRVDLKPAFHLGHSSPHPRIPPGPFSVTWTGVIFVRESGPLTFDANVGGKIKVEIAGVAVLDGIGHSELVRVDGKQPLNPEPGFHPITIRYSSLEGVAARLQIGWQGPTFSREPLLAWRLKHRHAEVSATARQDELAARGRHWAGRFGCARCHRQALPSVDDPPPGPSLADLGSRVTHDYLVHWLDDPARVHADARMPALFSGDRKGYVERWIVAEHLLALTAGGSAASNDQGGDHREGRMAFVSIGCTACHPAPDIRRDEQPDFERMPIRGLSDRLKGNHLVEFLVNPRTRYIDGRMPHLPLSPAMARDIAAYLLLWSKPTKTTAAQRPAAAELKQAYGRLNARDLTSAAATLIREKGCAECHPGFGSSLPADVAIRRANDSSGCLSGKTLPRFNLDSATRQALAAYLAVANREKHPSAFESRQRLLAHAGCIRCHQRDSDALSPLEEAGTRLGGAFLQHLPFQRTPRLTGAHQKYELKHLVGSVREGVSGLRHPRYSYRMPAFGPLAETLVQALAEADGDVSAVETPRSPSSTDPTAATREGPALVGFQGYSCVSCHLWNGQLISEADPGAIGPELLRFSGRIRRDWFDRFLDDPGRHYPGTPMPAPFTKGQRASLTSILDGDAAQQKDALWSYFALGKGSPSPKPPPPLLIKAPPGGPPIVAQIPIHIASAGPMESICILFSSGDLAIYDLGNGGLHSFYTGAGILRQVQGRLRKFAVAGTNPFLLAAAPPVQLVGTDKPEAPVALTFKSYDRLTDGVRISSQTRFAAGMIEQTEAIRLASENGGRRLIREIRFEGIPAGRVIEFRTGASEALPAEVVGMAGTVPSRTVNKVLHLSLTPDPQGSARASIRYGLPAARQPPPQERVLLSDSSQAEGSLARPGFRAIPYPRPKTESGVDLLMPAALAVHPRDGRVFVASMKQGEIFVVNDPSGDAKNAGFDNYANGLFQEAYSMHAEADGLYVLHRRNLTKIIDTDGDGSGDRFERIAALPHGVGNTYDFGYGLVRDRSGAFVISYAPYANTHLRGSGGAVRLPVGRISNPSSKSKKAGRIENPSQEPELISFGFRNPYGWVSGPDREVFFTDNQGEWMATNNLSHLVPGRYYGFPSPAQKQHSVKPRGKPAIWVPYNWARSINGAAYEHTGKFGPFGGQVFLAELMFGGAIIRANLEKVNGEYQGACFPFWGKGLLGPLCLAFDPKGRLWVGSITEPGWMAQPDRGALYRIDFTGETPFEIQSIHVLPQGFRLVFTEPVDPATAKDAAAYSVEHYRYEYTGAYGSPEIDRTTAAIEQVSVAADGRSVELKAPPLVKDRVYLIGGKGVRSAKGKLLVHPTGAYTLKEVPGK